MKMCNRSLAVALGVWCRCDYGRVGLLVGLDLLGGLFQSWWLCDCVHTHCTTGEIPMVLLPAWAGGATKQGLGAETGAGRAAVLGLTFFGDYSRNMATIISYISPYGGFRMWKIAVITQEWKEISKVRMMKAQCCCWAPASTAGWSSTVYQNIGDIKQILWANLYFWLALMIFAVCYLYMALLHSEHCNAWGHYCIGFTACWFCCWANLSRVLLEMCLASGWAPLVMEARKM